MSPFDDLTEDDKRALGDALEPLLQNPRIAAAVGYAIGVVQALDNAHSSIEDIIRRAWPSLTRKKWGSA